MLVRSLFLFTCLSLTLPGQAQRQNHSADQGSILNGHTYRNSALGMTISLPTTGQIIGKATESDRNSSKNSSRPSDCRGPLCGHPAIDVAIESLPLETPAYAILLGAYKLPPEYQDRTKHPLKNFAEVMALRSLGNLWIADTALKPMRLAGKPAVRLVVHNRKRPTARGYLYVSEVNGYVFLLVGTSASSDPKSLQHAIETMELGEGND